MKKLIIFLLVLSLVFLAALFIFVNIKGKDLAVYILEKNFNTPVSIGSVSLRLPFVVVVKDFSCGDINFKQARISPGLFLAGHIPLNRIEVDDLIAKATVSKEEIIVAPFFRQKITTPLPSVSLNRIFDIIPLAMAADAANKILPFKIGVLKIGSSTLIVKENITALGGEFIFSNIKALFKRIVYPELLKFDLDINASLESRQRRMEDLFSAKGWIDFSSRAMNVEVTIKDFDYLVLADYCPPGFKPKESGLKEGFISFKTDITAENNDMLIKILATAERFKFLEGEGFEGSNLRTILSLSRNREGKIILPAFEFHTTMDSPRIDYEEFRRQLKNATRKTISNVVGNVLGNAIGDLISGDKDAMDNLKNMFKPKKEEASQLQEKPQ